MGSYKGKQIFLLLLMTAVILLGSACSSSSSVLGGDENGSLRASESTEAGSPADPVSLELDDPVKSAVDFDHRLDSYQPHKDHYNFYFTYKTVHAWWDAVALGMEEAQRQYLDKGIVITYEYMAPEAASAVDQTRKLIAAQKKDYDVIGVDVADEKIITPLLNGMVNSGTKVMTFSSSDAAEGCKRLAYVGNTHNYQDGVDLTEALCKKLDYKGKVAILVGSVGAPCHEDRARGAEDTIAKYSDMEIVAQKYDMDSVDKAYDLTLKILKDDIVLSFDPGMLYAKKGVEELKEILNRTDVLLINEGELKILFEDYYRSKLGLSDEDSLSFRDLAVHIRNDGIDTVVVKRGAEGAYAINEKDEEVKIPAFKC